MPEDIFVEVESIEEQADLVLAEARSAAEKAVADAQAELAAFEQEAREKCETESARLRDEHEQHLSHEQTSLEDEYHRRRAHLDEIADNRTDSLADRVVSRFLEGNR